MAPGQIQVSRAPDQAHVKQNIGLMQGSDNSAKEINRKKKKLTKSIIVRPGDMSDSTIGRFSWHSYLHDQIFSRLEQGGKKFTVYGMLIST